MHRDITGIMPAGSFDPKDDFETKMIQIDRAKLCKTQFCYTRNCQCPIVGPEAREIDMDVSGLPCPDMSRAGNRLREEGPTAVVFGAHAKLHVACQTPLLIIENVRDSGFDLRAQ